MDDIYISSFSYTDDEALNSFINALASRYDLSDVRQDFNETIFLCKDLKMSPDDFSLAQNTFIDKFLTDNPGPELVSFGG